uniref:Peptidase S1 domain-containing protein n=1 Tax=Ditylenchus dipsaci TaxID=166011 RepID=A0A915DIV1_9BILA
MHFDTSSIRPICLPQEDGQRELPVGSRVMVVGWGRPNVFGVGDPLIRQIPMVHNAECKAPWSDSMPSHNEDYLCARALTLIMMTRRDLPWRQWIRT